MVRSKTTKNQQMYKRMFVTNLSIDASTIKDKILLLKFFVIFNT